MQTCETWKKPVQPQLGGLGTIMNTVYNPVPRVPYKPSNSHFTLISCKHVVIIFSERVL